MIEVVYIAGHERRAFDASTGGGILGNLLHEIGRNGAPYDSRLHPLTVALLVPDAAGQASPLHPRVKVIQSPLPSASSAGIRAALRDPVRRDDLAALPASSFRHLRLLSGLD